MKVYVALFVMLIVLVQLYSTYAELSGSALNSDNAERYVYKNNECRLLFQENKISGD
jgi:hypothetical protein